MKKLECIKKYGEEAYIKRLAQARTWKENNPEKSEAHRRERCRKGGKYYERKLEYATTGLSGNRNIVRATHSRYWRKYKRIVARGSQLHHQWIPGTSNYTGLAIVETDQHIHGFIDVIQILEGEISLFTEKEIREQQWTEL
jgi:hypothetical protein